MTMIKVSITFNDDLVDNGDNNDVFSCLKQRARIQIVVLFACYRYAFYQVLFPVLVRADLKDDC